MIPAILGLGGETLGANERALFREAEPAGYIVFARNCIDREQLRALTDELRTLEGRDHLPILMDQEGGRVARMKPPAWPEFPCGERFDALYRKAPMTAIEATRANAHALAATMREAGVNVNCLPLLDVRQPGADPIIGDRALGAEPMQVAALGRAVLEGLQAGGVVGVVKHMPGHGRATVDSHKVLPVVTASEEELETDLAPFRALRSAPMGMVAHVVYTAWDAERPSSQSEEVIAKIIRNGIGFDGFLITDDLGMQALSGGFDERTRLTLAAGCDVAAHCSGKMDEMIAVASAAGPLTAEARVRLERAMATIADAPEGPAYAELADKRDRLLASAA